MMNSFLSSVFPKDFHAKDRKSSAETSSAFAFLVNFPR